MTVRAYLRASTKDQDAQRAKDSLMVFARRHGSMVDATYIENISGTQLERPELLHLLDDAQRGDVILIEAVDRLTRLSSDDWETLRSQIRQKGLRIVSMDLPTSLPALKAAKGDEFTARMLDAVNNMMLDMLAAIARKDYEQRRERQAQGIAKAKQAGKYQGRKPDSELHKRIRALLESGASVRATAKAAGCAVSTVQRLKGSAKLEVEG